MPAIQCRAAITGVQPDPTPTTLFDWSIDITDEVRASTCPSSLIGVCRLSDRRQGVRGVWTPVFTTIQGGDAVITARATIRGVAQQASVRVRIRGTNPTAAAVTARLGGAGSAADRIACHESGRRQFDGTGMPLLGPGGDVGVMQMCNPAASALQRWDWTANVAAGAALLTQKAAAARAHLAPHVVAEHYPNTLNLSDADVLLRETIQRYNGGAYWTWNGTARTWEPHPATTYVATVLSCR